MIQTPPIPAPTIGRSAMSSRPRARLMIRMTRLLTQRNDWMVARYFFYFWWPAAGVGLIWIFTHGLAVIHEQREKSHCDHGGPETERALNQRTGQDDERNYKKCGKKHCGLPLEKYYCVISGYLPQLFFLSS